MIQFDLRVILQMGWFNHQLANQWPFSFSCLLSWWFLLRILPWDASPFFTTSWGIQVLGDRKILFLLPPSGMKFKETIDSKMQSNKSMHVLFCKELCIQPMLPVQHLARLLDPKDLFERLFHGVLTCSPWWHKITISYLGGGGFILYWLSFSVFVCLCSTELLEHTIPIHILYIYVYIIHNDNDILVLDLCILCL